VTTIAYKGGIVACDGRITSGSLIEDDDREKMIEREGVRFFMTGATADYDMLIAGYLGERVVPQPVDACSLVFRNGALTCVGVDEDLRIWEAQVPLGKPYAMGSGRTFALTAMDMGATAYQAVEMAAKRDTSTGGTIRTYEVAR
jgi:20S proteasome alpha/beta subunit